MTDLQLALLLLGAVIIIAVLAFNGWQERKFKNEAMARFDTSQADVLMEREFHFDTDAVLKDEEAASVSDYGTDFTPPDEKLDSASEQATTVRLDDTPEANNRDIDTPWNDEYETGFDNLTPPNGHTGSDQQLETAGTGNSGTTEEVEEEKWDTSDTGSGKVAGAAQEKAVLSAPGSMETDVLPLSPDIDVRIDAIAVLYLPQPVAGDKLREFLLSVTDLDKLVHVHGLATDGSWKLMTREQEGGSFNRASCSIQLADRSGFISRNTLHRFQHEVDRTGLKLNAQIEWQATGDPWLAASELDQFCIDVDKMVGFHLTQGANGPFTGTKFRGLAEARGLTLSADGAFHYQDESGQRLFSITSRDNQPFSPETLRISVIHGATFQLDIPRVRNCLEAFNLMVLTARQLESSLSATLVDDNQRALGETEIEKIRQQLKIIHAKMTTRGIIPGSPIALRLFS